MADETKRDMYDWLVDQIRSRIPKTFYERLAATRDPQEVEKLLRAEFKRVMDEIEAEGPPDSLCND